MFNHGRFGKFLATGEMPVSTALDAAMSEWDEKKHPRGGSKNKGQFKEKFSNFAKADDLTPSDTPKSEYDAIVAKYKGTDKWLKAPNGNDSNLTERQWVQVRTPSFKKWFGDWENNPANASKILDANGEPLVVWRGGNAKTAEAKENTFYTDQKYTALVGHAEGKEENVSSYFLNLRNPFMPIQEGTYDVWDMKKLRSFLMSLMNYKTEKGHANRDYVSDLNNDKYLFARKTDDLIRSRPYYLQSSKEFAQDWEDVAETAKNLGYDGLVGVYAYSREYLVFNPKNKRFA